MSWFDPEAIEAEKLEADMDMASLEAAGRRFGKARRRMLALRAAGDLDGAAQACTHGSGGYPLNSIAAQNDNDPRQGQAGVRCSTCGSALSNWPHEGDVTVIAPCEIAPRF